MSVLGWSRARESVIAIVGRHCSQQSACVTLSVGLCFTTADIHRPEQVNAHCRFNNSAPFQSSFLLPPDHVLTPDSFPGLLWTAQSRRNPAVLLDSLGPPEGALFWLTAPALPFAAGHRPSSLYWLVGSVRWYCRRAGLPGWRTCARDVRVTHASLRGPLSDR
jgi:hypothetical protein